MCVCVCACACISCNTEVKLYVSVCLIVQSIENDISAVIHAIVQAVLKLPALPSQPPHSSA